MSGEGTKEKKWTPEQELAISLKGKNLLVSAAAGAGKTAVLVERVIRNILSEEDPGDIERLLVVTFTEKAALEMKERVREALQKALDSSPGDQRLSRQLMLLDRAHISTIHSFCLYVVRRYFYKVGLDPSFRVLDANEAELLLFEALEDVFENWYKKAADSERTGDNAGGLFTGLVERYGGYGIDEGLKSLLLDLYNLAMTQPSPEDWLEEAASWFSRLSSLGDFLALPWTRVLLESALRNVESALWLVQKARELSSGPGGPEGYLPVLEGDLALYLEMKNALEELLHLSSGVGDHPSRASALDRVKRLSDPQFGRLPSKKMACDPELREKAKAFRNAAKDMFMRIRDYAFMRSVEEVMEELREVSPYVHLIKNLVLDLDRAFSAKKRERGGLDFSDLERYCLRILALDGYQVASELRNEFDYVLVDEYQDTNPVQEAILGLVSGGDEHPNMFMVGDIKQSIYRFRLAEPRIFLEKLAQYPRISGESSSQPSVRIDLSVNFRSRKEVISSVNYLFRKIMRKDTAEIDYDDDHELRPGAFYPEHPQEGQADDPYCTELHLIERNTIRRNAARGNSVGGNPVEGNSVEGNRRFSADLEQGELRDEGRRDDAPAESGEGGNEESPEEDYEALEKEALLVSKRIRELVGSESPLMLWDGERRRFRPCRYRDIAVLMRATKDRVNTVLEIFRRSGIPAYSETGTGYFRATEVEVALSLLSVIDNPRQDIPLSAILRSPMAGLSPRDLALVRSFHKKGRFYDAVVSFKDQDEFSHISSVIRPFLTNLERWRTMARRLSLAQVLWTILQETGYYDYVGGLPGGDQRQANLRALIDRAAQFDSFGRHGLFRFLRFIDRIRESAGDLGTARALGEHEDVVQVLSIHAAKGLEFPVVFVMDLGRKFNREDINKDVLFHRDLGICPMFCDVETRVKYPTLAYQAAVSKIQAENLAEEMRVLYVAMTRAREKLVLVGSVRGLEKERNRWQEGLNFNPATYLGWIGPSFVDEGEPSKYPLAVKFWGIEGSASVPGLEEGGHAAEDLLWEDVKQLVPPPPPPDPLVYPEIQKRLEWRYPYQALSLTRAKVSVGEIKSRLDLGLEEEDILRLVPTPKERVSRSRSRGKPGALERGIAVHSLLARMDLGKAARALQDNKEGESSFLLRIVQEEAGRLSGSGFLDGSSVDEEALRKAADFFRTSTGRFLVENRERVLREIPFTMRLPVPVPLPRQEESGTDFVVIQGVIDVLIEAADGVTILDYKTDDFPAERKEEYVRKYAPQVSLYALAAKEILRRRIARVVIAFLSPGLEADVDWEEELAKASSLLALPAKA